MYVSFKIALNFQVYVSNKPCLYLFPFWHRIMYFLTRFIYFKYSFNKCLELLLLCMLPNDTRVILSICIAVVDYTCIKSVRDFRNLEG